MDAATGAIHHLAAQHVAHCRSPALTMSSSHAVSVTAGDSCDGGEEEEEEEDDGKSESYSWEMQNGARASLSS